LWELVRMLLAINGRRAPRKRQGKEESTSKGTHWGVQKGKKATALPSWTRHVHGLHNRVVSPREKRLEDRNAEGGRDDSRAKREEKLWAAGDPEMQRRTPGSQGLRAKSRLILPSEKREAGPRKVEAGKKREEKMLICDSLSAA